MKLPILTLIFLLALSSAYAFATWLKAESELRAAEVEQQELRRVESRRRYCRARFRNEIDRKECME